MISAILRNTLMITSFVMVMMLLIEYINVVSRGKWSRTLQGLRHRQVLVCAFLGLVPGCLGGFVVVSLFTHGIVNFGALVACMIATFGDEAFIMFAMIPRTAAVLSAVIFVIAVLAGFAVNAFVKRFPVPFSPSHFAIHHSDGHDCAEVRGNWQQNIRHLSFERALLMAGIVMMMIAILLGWFEHSHDTGVVHGYASDAGIHVHGSHDHHGHDCGDISGILLQERWLNIL